MLYKVSLKNVLYIILFIAFSSCAFHKEFPFICFLKGCVAKQWHLNDLKATIKGMKGQANKRKQKREAKARKRRGEKEDDVEAVTNNKDKTEPDKIESPKRYQDSVLSLKPKKGIDTLITVNYLNEDDSLHSSDKIFLMSYIQKNGLEKISEITIQEYLYDDGRKRNNRTKELRNYFKELKVPLIIVYTNRSIHLKEKTMSEKIEIGMKGN